VYERLPPELENSRIWVSRCIFIQFHAPTAVRTVPRIEYTNVFESKNKKRRPQMVVPIHKN
jgi:hypothetical protein